MFESLILIKIIVSIAIVFGLSIVAEKASPKVAGILAGYPLGTAIVLFFIGLENGEVFAANSAVYALSGLSATLCFVFIYYKTSNVFSSQHIQTRWHHVFIPSLLATLSFLVIAALLSQFHMSLFESLLIMVVAIIFFSFQFKKIDNTQIVQKIKLTYNVILFRAGMAALIVLFITSIAALLGPKWSGILSAFPIALFPLILVIHLSYGKQYVHTIIKNFPHGLGALIVYTIAVSYLYPRIGIYIGSLVCLGLATVYLLLYSITYHFLSKHKLRTHNN